MFYLHVNLFFLIIVLIIFNENIFKSIICFITFFKYKILDYKLIILLD